MTDDDYDLPELEPFWLCEECGYKDQKRSMPVDRTAFYMKLDKGIIPKCPACHSATFKPRGF